MIDYQEIGNNIKICRIRCNLKQAELAEMVGVTSQHISHVERCQTKPSLTLLVDISTALRVDLYSALLFSLGADTEAVDLDFLFDGNRQIFAPIDHTSLQQITLLGRNKDSRVGRFYLKTATVDQIQRV